ncbi:MAG: hypothetical protein HY398_00410 [Candidatus Doudnabacteria bacterium]|nr:hypothetical protein [Candidatus Doudnabacteria bacterium]
MKVVYGPRFLKVARRLPGNIKKLLARQVEILEKDSFDPRLHTKMLAGELAGFFSFRITRDFRAIFRFLDKNTIQLLLIGNRKDIYK